MQAQILFISTMTGDPWGGSEELWSRTAVRLAEQGVSVAASVHGWPKLDSNVLNLAQFGIIVRPRPLSSSFGARVRRYISGKSQICVDIEMMVGKNSPRLVVISDGGQLPPIELVEMCVAKAWPFVTLQNANYDGWWFSDDVSARYRQTLPLARRCFFVSEANRVLAEMQLGYSFDNAEIVQNPVIIDLKSPIPWFRSAGDRELRLACVGRLYPPQKGQDILLQVLAMSRWAERNWRLSLYGEGPNRDTLERLIRRLDLFDRVAMPGRVRVEKIWRDNHILVTPSRFEGVPMTTIEAMLCGRPVVATKVGVNPEVIEDGITGFLAEFAGVEALNDALERMWQRRDHLQDIGNAAEASIRKYLLKDPIGIFAGKIRSLALLSKDIS